MYGVCFPDELFSFLTTSFEANDAEFAAAIANDLIVLGACRT